MIEFMSFDGYRSALFIIAPLLIQAYVYIMEKVLYNLVAQGRK